MGSEREYLKSITTDVKSGKRRRASVRSLLRQFGFARRGTAVIKHVRSALRRHGLRTQPDFADAPFNDQVSFVLIERREQAEKPAPSTFPRPAAFDRIAIRPYMREFEEAVPESGYRLLTDDFETHQKLLSRLKDENRVRVYSHGQNAYRSDRDEFPFYIAIDRRHLGRDLTELEDRYIRELAAEFGQESGRSAETEDESTIEPTEPAGATLTSQALEALESRIVERLELGLSEVRDELFNASAELQKSVSAQVDRLQQDAIRKVAALQNETELHRLIDEQDELQRLALGEKDDYIEALYEELSKKAAELEDITTRLESDHEEFDPEDAFSTVGRTLGLFDALSEGSPVLISDSARRSALESSSTKRREILQLLLTLRELADELFARGKESTIGPLREWFQARGYEYALQDAEVTTTKFGADRTFLVGGVQVHFKEHVTLFPNNNRDCVQVYFWRDVENRRLVVGYVGRHLRTNSREK